MKCTVLIGCRLEVCARPQPGKPQSPEQLKLSLEEVQRYIETNFSRCASVEMIAETDEYCASCGAPWVGATDLYNGGCCEVDQQDQEQRESVLAANEPQPVETAPEGRRGMSYTDPMEDRKSNRGNHDE